MSTTWTFLSNHAHVFFALCEDPDLRMREVADQLGITERAVQRIVHDLTEDGFLSVHKEGRRNHYEPNLEACLRHPFESHITVGQLVAALHPDAAVICPESQT